jgi:hypothetical protein
VKAVSIAMAESSGNEHAFLHDNDTFHSTDRGLWQINDHWHPDVSDACAYDRNCNAKHAYAISSQGTDFSGWVTFQKNMYQKFFNISQQGCKKHFG